MKRILSILAAIACITAMSSIAQAKSYRGFVEGGYGAFVGFFTRKLFLSLETNNAK